MQTESVPEKNSCESVLDNLTLKMTLDSSKRRQLFRKRHRISFGKSWVFKNSCSIIIISGSSSISIKIIIIIISIIIVILHTSIEG